MKMNSLPIMKVRIFFQLGKYKNTFFLCSLLLLDCLAHTNTFTQVCYIRVRLVQAKAVTDTNLFQKVCISFYYILRLKDMTFKEYICVPVAQR